MVDSFWNLSGESHVDLTELSSKQWSFQKETLSPNVPGLQKKKKKIRLDLLNSIAHLMIKTQFVGIDKEIDIVKVNTI